MPLNRKHARCSMKRRASAVLSPKEKRLLDELQQVRDELYGTADRDPTVRYENLKTYRIEMLRGFVLYTHLAMEDILKDFLIDFLRKRKKGSTVRQLKKSVRDMRSAEILAWCHRLNLITNRQYEQLVELNRIRNACGHHWLLGIPRYRTILDRETKRKTRIKMPVVRYNNKNLFAWDTFADEFMPVYGRLYLKLLFKDWKMRGVL
jgi:hypothetical protein